MKNNRGFTLVELLAVITILALVAFVALEAIDSVNKGNREKAEKIYAQNIITSAIAYVPTAKYEDISGNKYEIRLPDIEYSIIESGGNHYLDHINSAGTTIGRLVYWNKMPTNGSATGKQYSPQIVCKEGGTTQSYFLGDGCAAFKNKIEEVRISLSFLVRQGLLEDNLKNPRNGKSIDMNYSYVSIIEISRTNFKVLGNSNYEFNKDLLCKYDGTYLYCLFECYDGTNYCIDRF